MIAELQQLLVSQNMHYAVLGKALMQAQAANVLLAQEVRLGILPSSSRACSPVCLSCSLTIHFPAVMP